MPSMPPRSFGLAAASRQPCPPPQQRVVQEPENTDSHGARGARKLARPRTFPRTPRPDPRGPLKTLQRQASVQKTSHSGRAPPYSTQKRPEVPGGELGTEAEQKAWEGSATAAAKSQVRQRMEPLAPTRAPLQSHSARLPCRCSGRARRGAQEPHQVPRAG